MTDVLSLLRDWQTHGCEPESIGHAQIGRTWYAAGFFARPMDDRHEPPGERQIVLVPAYRTDWTTRDAAGPIPDLLPASYRRSHRTIYRDPRGRHFYVIGWHNDDGWLLLAEAPDWLVAENPPVQDIDMAEGEPFTVSDRLTPR